MTPILSSIAAAIAVTISVSAQVQPGLRMYGEIGERETFLIDEQNNVVHTWSHVDIPGVSGYLDPTDGTLLRTYWTGTPWPINGAGGGLRRFALDGTVLWDFRYDHPGHMTHHDIAILPNGNVLMLAWEEKTQQEAIAAGRDPFTLQHPVFRPDHIIEVQPTGATTGTVVWEWHVWDHLVQAFDPSKPGFGVIADHPGRIDINYPPLSPNAGDFNHMNSIDYDPIHDWIIVSARSQNEVWIIDHSTTTAEAAGSTGGNYGRGGELLYRWGNPAAYDRGTIVDTKLIGQHGAMFIPAGLPGAGNVLVFNNGAVNPGTSSVDEITLPLDANHQFILPQGGTYGPAAATWSYSAPDFGSSFVSNAERLPNGNTLICSGVQGWLFEITPTGQRVWEHQTGGGFIFQTHFVERTLWQTGDEISVANGGSIQFDTIVGANHTNEIRLLIGSGSGTTPGLAVNGMTLPLNFDGWMLTTLNLLNRYPFADTGRRLDPNGRATASFSIPGGIFPPQLAGTRLDHAFVIFDASLSPHRVSNPVRMTFVP